MVLVPPALQAGDTVGIVAPAGYLGDMDRYRTGCSVIRNMGFEIGASRQNWPGYGYLADTDDNRVEEFHRVWASPEVKAVFALRGGFGCLRILDRLDMDLIRRNPKFLVGFSDITILLNCIVQQTSLVCLHGPVLSSLGSADSATLQRLHQCLTGNWLKSLHENIEVLRGGAVVSGRLCGGNLSSLATLIGTPWAPEFTNSILFLEDSNEPPYRLDRLLTQCARAGLFEKVAGIILGDFTGDRDVGRHDRFRRHEFVWNRISELTAAENMPLWGNFPSGHGSKNITLPIGARSIMDSGKRRLGFCVDQDHD